MNIYVFWCDVSPFRINTYKSVSKQRALTHFRMTLMKNKGGRVQLLLTRDPKIADSGPAGKDFNPACPEPRRAEHPDERIASSAYGVYPDPVGVFLRLVLFRLST